MTSKYTYIKFYFTPEEVAHIKAQKRGYVRSLVKADMAGDVRDIPKNYVQHMDLQPIKMTPAPKPSGAGMLRQVQGPTCKVCGSMVLMGKCRVCGVRQ